MESASETSEISSDESYKPISKKNTYICSHEGCTATFSKNSKLVYHIRRHTGERPFVCNEPDCNKTYLYSFHLRRHKETHHSNQVVERICCPVEGCYLELANKYSLKKHLKRKHNPERNYPFNCEECQQGFHKKRQLLQHSYVHTGVLPFKCNVCEAGFPTTMTRDRHQRTHTIYTCKCEKTFERWSHLLIHKKTCETVRPKCTICDKTFTQRVNLKTHLKLHLQENVKAYSCKYDNCTRSYIYKKNLLYHINKYHKKIELPRIACTEPNCKQTFTRRQTLQSHVNRFHSKQKKVNISKRKRNPRKDKGLSRTSTAAALAGLELPQKLHLTVIQGQPVTVPTVSKPVIADKQSNLKENIKNTCHQISQEAIHLLKDKLKKALLKNVNATKLKTCETSDNTSNETCIKTLC